MYTMFLEFYEADRRKGAWRVGQKFSKIMNNVCGKRHIANYIAINKACT